MVFVKFLTNKTIKESFLQIKKMNLRKMHKWGHPVILLSSKKYAKNMKFYNPVNGDVDSKTTYENLISTLKLIMQNL